MAAADRCPQIGVAMAARENTGPDFVEALARGLDILRCFRAGQPAMTLAQVATATALARPTARRLLLTLEELGYVRADDGTYRLTPRVLELGTAYARSLGLWDVARPHMEHLVRQTRESCSMAQLDGSDIVYVARVAVPKIIALAVTVGTRFPAPATSLGKVLLAALSPAELAEVLAQPSRSGVTARRLPTGAELDRLLRQVRARGWAVTDEHLAPGVRSIAAPVRDGQGLVVSAVNVTVHAAETSLDTLLQEHLPRLLQTASAISADWATYDQVPEVTLALGG